MSEFIAVMGGSNNEMTVSELTTGRVMTGDPESVRGRLVYALESLGYVVVSDNPIQARRARRKDIFRADFLDHPRRLAVGLRQVGAAATQATFDFAVTHGGCSTNGDLLTLEREADAVVALAEAPTATGVCLSCGTENGEGARFCRLCGAPNATGAPAEVEVMRLTAGSRAGLQEIVCGVLTALLSAAVSIPMLLAGKPKAFNVGLAIFIIGEVIGLLMAFYGMLRIHRMLRARPEGQTPHALPAFNPDAAAATARRSHAQASALPPRHFSVTEGTTELLTPTPREAERVPVRRRERSDTGPVA